MNLRALERELPSFVPGDQVAYIPEHVHDHVWNKATIPDGVEFGFVTSVRHGAAFCRFWNRTDFEEDRYTLRTTANSERVDMVYLKKLQTVPLTLVKAYMIKLGYNE